MAKSSKKKAAKGKTPQQILALWVTSFKSAIGSKTLDKEIAKEFEQGLLDSITVDAQGRPKAPVKPRSVFRSQGGSRHEARGERHGQSVRDADEAEGQGDQPRHIPDRVRAHPAFSPSV